MAASRGLSTLAGPTHLLQTATQNPLVDHLRRGTTGAEVRDLSNSSGNNQQQQQQQQQQELAAENIATGCPSALMMNFMF